MQRSLGGHGFGMFKGQWERCVACGWREEGAGRNRKEETRSQGAQGQSVAGLGQKMEIHCFRRVFLVTVGNEILAGRSKAKESSWVPLPDF